MRLDTVVLNARILTGAVDRPVAHRLGIWQGRIVGVDEQLDPFVPAGSSLPSARTVLDARGATVLPGFNDVHAHSVWFGQTLIEVDLSQMTTAEQIHQAIAERAQQSSDEWLVCSNYNPLKLVGPRPDRDVMDRAAQGRPVLIKHASGHAYTVNGVALQAAGIEDYPRVQPEGGVIDTDGEGRATGLLDENAMRAVQALIQPESQRQIIDALDAASQHYLSEGITSVTDAGVAGGWIGHSPVEFAAYQTARDQGRLAVRTQTMVTLDALHEVIGHESDAAFRTLDAGVRSGLGDEFLQLGPVKVFTDGSLLGTTAAMTEHYVGCPHHHGYMQGDEDQMRAEVRGAAASGWSLALHAIGDAAIDFAVDSIEQARAEYGPGPMPDRIEHGGVVRDDQLRRMATQGIVLVPQPYFIPSFGDGMARSLGTDRVQLSYPARRLLDAGMLLPGSSDRPVAHGAPLAVIQAFVERHTETGAEYGPAERISAAEAVTAYTAGSAAATGWGLQKGQLMAGHLADLVVLEADPLQVPTAEISRIPVRATLVGGNVRYGDVN